MRRFLAGLVRRAKTNRRPRTNQHWLVGDLQRRINRILDRIGIMTIDTTNHMPTVSFETARRIVRKPTFNVAVDRDVVIVPKRNQLIQSPRSRERSGFMGDAFHQATVTHEHPGAVINDVVTILIETVGKDLLSQRKTHRIRETLTQWTGRRFNAVSNKILRVTRCLRTELTEIL